MVARLDAQRHQAPRHLSRDAGDLAEGQVVLPILYKEGVPMPLRRQLDQPWGGPELLVAAPAVLVHLCAPVHRFVLDPINETRFTPE